MSMQSMRNPVTVREAIADTGSMKGLCDRLGVTRAAVYVWLNAENSTLPELYQYRFHLTAGNRERKVKPWRPVG